MQTQGALAGFCGGTVLGHTFSLSSDHEEHRLEHAHLQYHSGGRVQKWHLPVSGSTESQQIPAPVADALRLSNKYFSYRV